MEDPFNCDLNPQVSRFFSLHLSTIDLVFGCD